MDLASKTPVKNVIQDFIQSKGRSREAGTAACPAIIAAAGIHR